MHDATNPTQKQLEEEHQKYMKLRDDHQAHALEARALKRLKELRQAINGAVEEYNDQTVASQWKWPVNSRPRLSLIGSLSELEAAIHERRIADLPDPYGQPYAVADVNLQGPPSCEVRDLTVAASDQYDQFNGLADVNLQDSFTQRDEVIGLTNAAPDQAGQSNTVADEDFQDVFIESDDVRGSSDAAPDQSDQSTVGAEVFLQDHFTEGAEVRGPTEASIPATGQPDAVADETLQDSFTLSKKVRGSTDAALDQSKPPNSIANVSFQGPFAENSESVRDSAVGDGSSLFGVCDADEYAASVHALAAMLQELDEHHDSFNKGFIQVTIRQANKSSKSSKEPSMTYLRSQ